MTADERAEVIAYFQRWHTTGDGRIHVAAAHAANAQLELALVQASAMHEMAESMAAIADLLMVSIEGSVRR